MTRKFNKTLLCIIDGCGNSAEKKGNATLSMKNLNDIYNQFGGYLIKASGKEVGLDSDKDAGNSEVGHNAIGAGKTIKQGLALLNDAFSSGEIFKSKVWKDIKDGTGAAKLNLIILLSDGHVHSDIEHLYKVLDQCRKDNIKTAVIGITDGRDVSPRSCMKYIESVTKKYGNVFSVIGGRGRFFMDRYKAEPELLTKAYNAAVKGIGEVEDSRTFIKNFYDTHPTATDEQIPICVINKELLIKNKDAVLLLNYRGDRAVETCEMFEKGEFISAEDFNKIKDCYFAGILQYDSDKGLPKNYLCPPPKIDKTLTEQLCKLGVLQYSITETVKFGHLTYFFNGNRAKPFDNELEKWVEIESDKLNNQYDKAPKMKALEITDKLVYALRHENFDFYKVNYPNPDMVGHTGNFEAAKTACEFCDRQIKRLFDVCKENKINLIITADHGNAEKMLDANGQTVTSHTNNPVPFIVCPFASPNLQLPKIDGLTGIAGIVKKLLL
ncbi:MAG: 2,3-bisphosphoglycerate-independent phosphoglycerate mutase [Christensenellaceae bacterium]|jgi:2,3-bisphosphoglycerate-independent phosphoglycerate mutase|nr:2,3-bisphosphoglycerate-independent phosphoglycerate mutase [Christensenellaceae bacterium]